jgi:glycosyltransferase involved in cell wall biosynthesis
MSHGLRPGHPPRVLHAIANLDVGGAQEVVRSLLPHLLKLGWAPVVATYRDGPMREALRSSGIPVHVLPARRSGLLERGGIAEMANAWRDLRDLCRREDIALIQTHLLRSLDFAALSARRGSGVQAVLWTVHNARPELRADQVPHGRWLLAPKRLGYRWAYRLGTRAGGSFVAVSRDVGTAVQRELHPPPDRLHIIPNGVDVGRYANARPRADTRAALGIAQDTPVLISVAKLHEQKGHADLIAALGPVVASHPDVCLLLVGEGPLREQIARQVVAAGLAAQVRFLGLRDDVPDLLAAADAFVLASHWEGLPMALLEAMACGLPSVATDVSGTLEVALPGATGLVVPPGKPTRLAEAIAQLLADRPRAAQMGRNARAHVARSHSAKLQA